MVAHQPECERWIAKDHTYPKNIFSYFILQIFEKIFLNILIFFVENYGFFEKKIDKNHLYFTCFHFFFFF